MGDFNMRECVPLGSSSDLNINHRHDSLLQRLLTSISLDTMKRKAHREAWYGKSSNPFRRTRSNSSNYQSRAARDLEAQMEPGVARSSTEPIPPMARTNGLETVHDTENISPTTVGGNSEKYEPSSARMTGAGTGSAEQLSAETAVEVPPNDASEQHGVGRLMARFRGSKKQQRQRSNTIASQKSQDMPKPKKFTFGNQIRATLFNSWINLLIFAAPVGIALYYVPGINPLIIFLVNFVAIIPLAALLSYATEEIALRVGEVLGGLLNATFGNAVELIVSIIALQKKETLIVKTSLIGSMLSNLLLVMGMCFFFGGLRRSEQFFNVTVATTAASLLALAIAGVMIPTAFDLFTSVSVAPTAALSRGTAVILFIVYCCYLLFQLKTHSAMYQEESKKVAMRPLPNHVAKGTVFKALAVTGAVSTIPGRTNSVEAQDIINPQAFEEQQAAEDDEPDEPQLHFWVAIGTLLAATVVIALCAEYMVDSIDAFTSEYNISRTFVGLILLPIVGNAAEHATAVTVACKDKMDLAIGVAVGSSMQVALLILPLMIIIGWGMGEDGMNLSFDGFQIVVLFVSVLLVNYLIGDGKSHWLEGVMLQCLYIIIAVS
ncbi:MAG: hypothetical protein M1818_003833 [Claussenomyces sp. TS43310]|nr:MAG: hypothetical protein M1818_003833 [Claussenomyces sp. TS43310]